MNLNKFKAKMVLNGDNLKTLAEYLGISYMTLSNKLKGEYDFTQTEMILIRKRYGLTDEEFNEFFMEGCVMA